VSRRSAVQRDVEPARRLVASLRRLAFRDASIRLLHRLVAWLATALAGYALLVLVAVATADSALALGPMAFHAIALTLAGSLPAFLAYPFPSTRGLELLRRLDSDASVEAWLDYDEGPAGPLLERRARLALELAKLRYHRPRPSRRGFRACLGLGAIGLIALATAQALSLADGRGLSLGYPRERQADVIARLQGLEATGTVSEAASIEPDLDDVRQGSGAHGLRRRAPSDQDEALAEPDFIALRDAASEASDETTGPKAAPRRAASADDRRGASAPGSEALGSLSGGHGPGDDGGRDQGEARAPGYEGRGRALAPSPLIDYRVRFERELAEATGRETRLGANPSAELLTGAIRDYYASFDLRVSPVAERDPLIHALEAAWARAFGASE